MAQKDLIPFNTMDPERAHAIQVMGGKAKSPRKKYAAKLRELKKKGMTNDTAKHWANLMEDPEYNILDIYRYIESIKETTTNATQEILLAKTLIDLHQANFGKKIQQENKNFNVNVNLAEDTAEILLRKIMEEK